MSDFGEWLKEVEMTSQDLANMKEPEPDVAPAREEDGRLFKAKWPRDNPKLHQCMDCGGTGIWVPRWSTTYRPGICHKCKGKGHFKTSIKERRKQREARRLAGERKLTAARDEFKEQHPGLIEFLYEAAKWSDFANNLVRGEWGFEKRGSLSEKQVAAAMSMREKVEARRAAQQESAEKEESIDLTDVPSGYYAVPGGATRLKVRINRPGKNSRWHGYTFVTDGAAYGAAKRYGRQAPGELYRGDIVEQLKAIAKDPAEASKAYGKLVGRCGVCNRILEDEQSIEAGIGPICAGKLGW